MSPLSRLDPPATLDLTPSACQAAFHGKQLQKRSPEIGHVPSLLRSGNPLRWIPGPSQQSTLPRRVPTPPRRPRSGLLPQSRRRDMTSADPSASSCRASPVFAMRTHPKRNATHLALGAPTAAPSSPTTAQHLSAFPISLPRQQRGEGHSRSCSTNITASQASWILLHVVQGQPACLDSPSPNKLPPEDIPGLSAPERNARQPSVAASSQAVGHRRFAAGHLD